MSPSKVELYAAIRRHARAGMVHAMESQVFPVLLPGGQEAFFAAACMRFACRSGHRPERDPENCR